MAKAQGQRGFLGDTRDAVVNFYKETMGELRKVVWPTWLEARNLTIIVLIVIFVIFILIIDKFPLIVAMDARPAVNFLRASGSRGVGK